MKYLKMGAKEKRKEMNTILKDMIRQKKYKKQVHDKLALEEYYSQCQF